METRTPMAYERITMEKANELLKAYVQEKVAVKEGEPHYYKYVRESGLFEALLGTLIAKNPTYIANQLNLIEVRYELHEVMEDFIETKFIESFLLEDLAKWSLAHAYEKHPTKMYRLVTKIYEK